MVTYYSIARRGLTDTYAQLPKVRSTQGRVLIYQSNAELAVLLHLRIFHFAKAQLMKEIKDPLTE